MDKRRAAKIAESLDDPNIVYGRLQEAVHITGYTFERACSELQWLLTDDRWQQCNGGYIDVQQFVGSLHLSDFKIIAEKRRDIAKRLAAIGASQRATARALGVDKRTVGRDLNDGANAPSTVEKPNGINGANSANGANAPPPEWFADPAVDPAKLAKKQGERAKAGERREQRLEEINSSNRPLNAPIRYPILYADPPWRYENPPIGASSRSIENHYPTMTLEEICALPVAEISADDAMLYLWATAPKLAECMQVITAWGFVYRTNMVWDKELIGNGYHARNQHELLLICKRGEIPPPAAGTQPPSVYRERRGGHSVKPDFFAEMIERAYPSLPKIELFRRGEPRSGWDCWGNQAEEALA